MDWSSACRCRWTAPRVPPPRPRATGRCAVRCHRIAGRTWDERLSSAAVNRFLIDEADLTRAKRAEAVDRAAAAWMLQAALDAGSR